MSLPRPTRSGLRSLPARARALGPARALSLARGPKPRHRQGTPGRTTRTTTALAVAAAAIAVLAPTGPSSWSPLTGPTTLPHTAWPQVAATTAPATTTAPDDPANAVVPPGASPGAGTSVEVDLAPGTDGATRTLTGSGIPARAQQAYRRAAALAATTHQQCRLDWTLLAGIGRVESDHGRFAGAAVGADGKVTPRIIGPRLDGSREGWATIHDSDGGRYDGDTAFDRAVGPMQFLPGTWTAVAADADGDGTTDPQDLDDAAYAAARYLCSGGGDLTNEQDRWAAVFRYNRSDSYVGLVLGLADSYATGVPASLPAPPTGPRPTPTGDPATTGRPPAVHPQPHPTRTRPLPTAPRPTRTASASAGGTPSASLTPTTGTASASPSGAGTPTCGATATPTPTSTATATAGVTAEGNPTPTGTLTPGPTPSDCPSASTTATASPTPTQTRTGVVPH